VLVATWLPVGCGTYDAPAPYPQSPQSPCRPGPSGVSLVPTNPPPHALPSRPPTGVEILSSGPPTRPHTDVALLHFWWFPTYECPNRGYIGDLGVLAKLRKEASAQGCDAIVLGSAAAYSSATCVVYANESK
jgi:hypothetical protein